MALNRSVPRVKWNTHRHVQRLPGFITWMKDTCVLRCLITPAWLQVCFQRAVDRHNLLFLAAVCAFLLPMTNVLFLRDICPLNLLVAMSFLSTLATYPPLLLLSFFFAFCRRRLCLPLAAPTMPHFLVLQQKVLVCTSKCFNFLFSCPRLSPSPFSSRFTRSFMPRSCSNLEAVAPAHVAQLWCSSVCFSYLLVFHSWYSSHHESDHCQCILQKIVF